MLAHEEPDPDPLVQMNVRVPKSLRAAIDVRRADLTDPVTGKPMSRDRWVANATKYALEAPRRPTAGAQRRTARPKP